MNVVGKEAMQGGPAAFSKVASETCKKMGDEDKKLLDDYTIVESNKTMSIRVIKKEGSQLFQKIELQVCPYLACT